MPVKNLKTIEKLYWLPDIEQNGGALYYYAVKNKITNVFFKKTRVYRGGLPFMEVIDNE